MAQFRKHLNITELERSIVVALIDRILIYIGQPRGSPLPLCGTNLHGRRIFSEDHKYGGGGISGKNETKDKPGHSGGGSSPYRRRSNRAAAYVRLSVEDSGKPGADTIEGQKNLLLRFIEDDPTLPCMQAVLR